MARVLPGTAPQMTAQCQVEPSPAIAWIEAHYDAWRGQWVAVRLEKPVLVASAPTLSQLLQATSATQLKACLVHYIHTLEEESQVQGPEWQG